MFSLLTRVLVSVYIFTHNYRKKYIYIFKYNSAMGTSPRGIKKQILTSFPKENTQTMVNCLDLYML